MDLVIPLVWMSSLLLLSFDRTGDGFQQKFPCFSLFQLFREVSDKPFKNKWCVSEDVVQVYRSSGRLISKVMSSRRLRRVMCRTRDSV